MGCTVEYSSKIQQQSPKRELGAGSCHGLGSLDPPPALLGAILNTPLICRDVSDSVCCLVYQAVSIGR